MDNWVYTIYNVYWARREARHAYDKAQKGRKIYCT